MNYVKLADQIGFDVPINLEKKNTFLTGKKGEILRLNQKFKLKFINSLSKLNLFNKKNI